MDEQRYNKRVRQAISDKYVEYSKMYADTHKEFIKAESRLKGENAKKELSYDEYVDLEKYIDNLREEMKVLKIQIDIWDAAGETKHAFTIKLSELLAVMTKLKPYLSKSDAKPILKGIHVKGAEGFGTFYGCTGFYGIRQTIHGNFDTFSIVIPEVSKELKDISGVKNNKQDCDITVTHSKRLVVYEGADFKFATRLLEGEYINLENPFNSTFESSFNADASEICGLAKEYKDILIHKTATSKTFLPMIFTNVGGVLSTIALSNQIQTMDNLDSADNVSMPEEYIQSFNPEFVETVMKTFGKESVCVNANKSLWRINGNSDCSVLLVPMRSDKDTVSKIHDMAAIATLVGGIANE